MKKKRVSKMLAVALSLAMVLGTAAPQTAFADEISGEGQVESGLAKNEAEDDGTMENGATETELVEEAAASDGECLPAAQGYGLLKSPRCRRCTPFCGWSR